MHIHVSMQCSWGCRSISFWKLRRTYAHMRHEQRRNTTEVMIARWASLSGETSGSETTCQSLDKKQLLKAPSPFLHIYLYAYVNVPTYPHTCTYLRVDVPVYLRLPLHVHTFVSTHLAATNPSGTKIHIHVTSVTSFISALNT